MKIHHSTIPLEDRIAHVLRNDRERTGQFIADTLGLNKTGVVKCLGDSGRFDFRKAGNSVLWRVKTVSLQACQVCSFEFDVEKLGKYGCPNCEGEA